MNEKLPSSLLEAQSFLRTRIQPVIKTQALSITDAIGSVLAEDIIAPASLPRFDNAAMDGYAVRRADLSGIVISCE